MDVIFRSRTLGRRLTVLRFRGAVSAGIVSENDVRTRYYSDVNNMDAIRLWHLRLGHPNLMYLEHLFPSLGINKV